MRAVKLSGKCLGDDLGLASYALTNLVFLRAQRLGTGKEERKRERELRGGVPRHWKPTHKRPARRAG